MSEKLSPGAVNPGVSLLGGALLLLSQGTHQHPHAAQPRVPWEGRQLWEVVLVGRGLRGLACHMVASHHLLWTPGPADLSGVQTVSIAPLHRTLGGVRLKPS